MKKDIVIKATYKTEILYSEGYFYINGNSVKGIFGLDFLEITYDNNFFHLSIFERDDPNDSFDEDFYSEYLCMHYGYTTISCPEEYTFMNSEESFLTLKLQSIISSTEKKNSVISELSKIVF